MTPQGHLYAFSAGSMKLRSGVFFRRAIFHPILKIPTRKISINYFLS
jgi:hypothetical protein